MATPALIVVITVAVTTLVALAVVVLLLVRRVRELASSLRQVQQELEPGLETLSREASVIQDELQRLSEQTQQVTRRGSPAGEPGVGPLHSSGTDRSSRA